MVQLRVILSCQVLSLYPLVTTPEYNPNRKTSTMKRVANRAIDISGMALKVVATDIVRDHP